MQKNTIALLLCAGMAALTGCEDEEVAASQCYPAIVLDQGCGTVLAILDPTAAEVVGSKPSNDTVYVNTFDLHPVYQVPNKKVYITFRLLAEDEGPECPVFIPIIYPQVKLLSTQEAACQ